MTETTHKKTAGNPKSKKSMVEGKSKTTGEKTGSNESKNKETGPDASSNSNSSPDDGKKNYVRGEAQKPVTTAYRNNWKAIFNKKH